MVADTNNNGLIEYSEILQKIQATTVQERQRANNAGRIPVLDIDKVLLRPEMFKLEEFI